MPDGALLSAVEREAVIEIARRARLRQIKPDCEADLLAFIREFWPVLEPETAFVEGWPLDQLCALLMAVTDGHLNRVIINIPPGFMKSLTLNVFFVAWLWGPCNLPHLRFISASYSAGLTERDNGKLVRLVTSETYRHLWGDRVKLVKDGVGKVETSKTGWKLATSVGGTTTGERGDYILVDDANNPQTVESETVRDTTNRWIREVMPSRLNNAREGVIINLQQRTHESDATGTLAEFGSGYSWWVVPMEYDPLRDTPLPIRWDDDGAAIEVLEDPRGRTPLEFDADGNWLGGGEVLEGRYADERDNLKLRMGSPLARVEGLLAWPERYDTAEVEKLKVILGPYAYAGQFQQSPTVRGGGVIRRDWWQPWTADDFPDLGTVVAGLDTAIKESEENDYNAFQTWGAFPGPGGEPKLIITSAWKVRCSLAELVARVAESCWERKVDYLVIEDKTRGHDVAAEIVRQYGDAPWQTVLIPANGRGAFSGDKVARLQAVAPLFSGDVRRMPAGANADGTQRFMDVWSGGMVYAPDRTWADEVINEVTNFPRGAHDDHADVTALVLAFVRRTGVVLRRVEHERDELEARKFKRKPGLPYAIGS